MRRAAQLVLQAARQAAGSAPALSSQPAPLVALRSATGAAGHTQWRWSHCSCSGDLSLPPPQKVLVEYSPAEVDTFIAFADAVEEEFEGIMVDGVEVPDRPNAFDIRLEDGQTIYSRAEEAAAPSADSLPQYSDLFARLRAAGLQAAV